MKRLSVLLVVTFTALTAGSAVAASDVDAARYLITRQRYAEAMTQAERAVKAAPESPAALDVYGEALMVNGRLEEAVASIRKALDKEPRNALFLTHLGQAQYRQFVEGVARWAKEHGDSDMLGTITSAVPGAQAGGSFRYAPEGGPVPGATDQTTLATRIPTEAVDPRFDPGHSAMGALRRPWAKMNDAEKARHEAPARQALATFDEALSIQPDLVDATRGRAACLYGLGQFVEAGRAYEKVAATRKTEPGAWAMAADSYALADKPEEAIRCWHKTIEVEPLYATAYQELGRLYEKNRAGAWETTYYGAMLRLLQGKPGDAVKSLKRVTEEHPDFGPGWRGLGSAQLGAKKAGDAVKSLRKAVEVTPADGLSHYELGVALAEVGEDADAMKALTRAAELRPDYPRVWFALGSLSDKMKDPDSAISYYERAVELRPAWAEAHENLGSVLLQRGRGEEGVWYLERYLALKPDAPDAKEVREVIAKVKGK
jgi:tetratricopeptide (TPR) repeat protein